MSTRKVPTTDSIQKLAKFWDVHDLTDYGDELEEVTEPVFERGTPIELRLQGEEAEAVRRMARAKGVTEEQLIHEWVRQRLSRSKGSRSRKKRPPVSRPRAGKK